MVIKGVLLDVSGVIYVGNDPLPGSVAAVDELRSRGLAVRFVTNTTSAPKRSLLQKLADMGVEAGIEELFTPAQAACDYLAARQLQPHLLISPRLMEDFTDVMSGDGGKAVIIGDAGDAITYKSLNEAFHELQKGAEFIALAANRTFKDDAGEISLDTGAFVAALEFASQRKATVLGKPAPGFFDGAVESMGLKRDEVAMIGDDAEADVSGAIAAGLVAGLLVRTGKYAPGAEAGLDPAPTVIVDDLAAAVKWIFTHTDPA